MGIKEMLGITTLTPEEKRERAELMRERAELARQKRLEIQRQTTMTLNIQNGFQQLNVNKITQIRQKENGTVYFGMNDGKLYTLIGYDWSGPQYNIITNSVKSGIHKKKGKAGKIGGGAAAGAAIGSVVPFVGTGIGAAVGAAMGAGSKGKKTINENTRSLQQQVEIDTPATLRFKDVDSDQVIGITIICNSIIDAEIKKFTILEENKEMVVTHKIENAEDKGSLVVDKVEELKKMKDLLDYGVVTQEEFELKKKQILGL